MRGSVFRIDCDCPPIGRDRGSKLTGGMQRNPEIHVSRGESVVRFHCPVVVLTRFGCLTGRFRDNAAVHQLLRQPSVAIRRQLLRAAAP